MSDDLNLEKVDEIHEEKNTYNLEESKKNETTKDSDQAINKDMLISEVIERYPELIDIFLENGLHCVGCALSPFDTIDMGCRTHGWEDEQIDEFVEKLNDSLITVDTEEDDDSGCCGGGCGCGHNKEKSSCCQNDDW